jgi:hypothetical protein
MGKIQGIDAVAKHHNTSFYGNTVALSESPLVEGLIYVGTDDGLIQVTEDGGENWRRIALFPGVPDITYVSFLAASQHDADTVYATFDNHKNGDFKPYALVSRDRGHNWTSIAGDLPERDIVYTVVEDHVDPELLFAGTEFGVYFTVDGGTRWVKLKGGIPTISVHDLAIQARENDLVVGTFGRSFYILDDYTPLRMVSDELLDREAVVFPIKDALRYIETSRLGGRSGRGSQGASFYAAPNPPFGAVFTYYLKEKLTTRKERRKEAEKKAEKSGTTPPYPTYDELRAEDEEKEPSILLIVRDGAGEVVRRITGPRGKGVHRVAWDLRYPASNPVRLKKPEDRSSGRRSPAGPLALPGSYSVTLAKEVDGEVTTLADPETFEVVPLELATFAAQDRAEVLAFRKKVARLNRAVRGALGVAGEAESRLAHIRHAVLDTPAADPVLLAEIDSTQKRLNGILVKLRGDRTLSKRNEPTPPSISGRVRQVVSNQWNTTSAPTQTQRDAYQYAGTEFAAVLAELRTLIEDDLARLEAKLEASGAPWTPGRIPVWEME